jgi:hypothetical protein
LRSGLRIDCTAIASRLSSDYESIAQRLRVDCAAIGKRLWSDYESISQRLRLDCAAITNRLRSDYESIAQRLRIDRAAIANRLRSDCELIAQRLESIAHRLKSFRIAGRVVYRILLPHDALFDIFSCLILIVLSSTFNHFSARQVGWGERNEFPQGRRSAFDANARF